MLLAPSARDRHQNRANYNYGCVTWLTGLVNKQSGNSIYTVWAGFIVFCLLCSLTEERFCKFIFILMPVIKLLTKIGRIIATFDESVTSVVSTVSAVIVGCGLNVLFINGAVIITRISKNYRRKTTPYPEFYFVTTLWRNARTKKSPVNRSRGD